MTIKVSSEILDGCVLAILEYDDRYGYELTQQVQLIITVSESTTYPVLRRLKKNGWLTTHDEPYQGRNRRYYHLTDSGREQLGIIREEWHHFSYGINKMIGDETNHE